MLSDLMAQQECRSGSAPVAVTGLAYHAAQVTPGAMFFAWKGAAADGHAFIAQAIANGATTIVAERELSVPKGVSLVVVANAREMLGLCSARWFDQPTQQLRLVGITGTNGKTTSTYVLESIWSAAGRRPGVLGTVNYRYGDVVMPAATTTPESYDVQRLARNMVDHGVTDLAMEVSSHALTQYRVDACHFAGALFTNLTQDHLDYHADMAAYRAAKQHLFGLLDAQAFAAINADDPAGRAMAEATCAKVWWYGLTADATVYPVTWQSTLAGIAMDVASPSGTFTVQSPLVGQFNVYNLLGAITVALASHVPVSAIQVGVAAMANVPGRLERVGAHAPAVFVDYAHSPDALLNVLQTLRPLTKGRLITVFGCGGDRDRSKRPLMGEAVARLSDVVVVTSDNPRTENPESILDEILPGVESGFRANAGSTQVCQGSKQLVREVNRRRAIHLALQHAAADDVVLVAGKGHEDYQIIGTTKHHFDDREVVREFFGNMSS